MWWMWWMLSACTHTDADPRRLGAEDRQESADTGGQTTACPWVGGWTVSHVCGGAADDLYADPPGAAVVVGENDGCAVSVALTTESGCAFQEDIHMSLVRYEWVAASAGGFDSPVGCLNGATDPRDLGQVDVVEDGASVYLGFEFGFYGSGACPVNGGFTLSP